MNSVIPGIISQTTPIIQRQNANTEFELEAATPEEVERLHRHGIDLPRVSAQAANPWNHGDYIDRRMKAVGYGIYIGSYYIYCDGLPLPILLPDSYVAGSIGLKQICNQHDQSYIRIFES